MRLNNSINAVTETNQIATKSHTFEIGDQSIVIDILRNRLYSNPIQTLVQEYVSNARDAHREAGTTRPIEITLPEQSDLTLRVRDFGPGLSPERVKDIFTKYGNSTKRGSNSQTGGFGIGAKSAWAYTDAFTVISYYDKKAFHYIAHITKEKTGSLDLVSEVNSIEPNGVEIQIPIKKEDIEYFCDACFRATDFWDVKEYPKFTNAEYAARAETIDRLGDFETVNTGSTDKFNHDRKIFIVVDGIPYPMPDEFRQVQEVRELSWRLKTDALFHFKTGEIEVSASREDVTNNPANKGAVINAVIKAAKDLNNMLNQKVTQTHTLREALNIHLELSQYYSHSKNYVLNYSGHKFTLCSEGRLESLIVPQSVEKYQHGSSYRRSENLKKEVMMFADYRSGNWFYADDETSHAHQMRRVKPMATSCPVYILKGDLNNPDFQTLIKELNIKGTSTLGPASTRKSTKKENADDILINIYPRPGSRQTTSKLVTSRNQTTYVYVIKKDKDETNWQQMNNILAACDVSFCLVSETTSKHIVNNPKFISFNDFLKQASSMIPSDKLPKLINSLKEYVLDMKGLMGWKEYPIEIFKKLSKETIQDSDLQRAISVLSTVDRDDPNNKLFNVNAEKVRINTCKKVDKLLNSFPETAEYLKQREVMETKLNQYLLLTALESGGHDKNIIPCLVTYLNAAFGGAK